MRVGIDTGGTNVDAVVASLAGFDTSNIREPAVYEPPSATPGVDRVIDRVTERHAGYWDF